MKRGKGKHQDARRDAVNERDNRLGLQQKHRFHQSR
jgi:hypothetical protein